MALRSVVIFQTVNHAFAHFMGIGAGSARSQPPWHYAQGGSCMKIKILWVAALVCGVDCGAMIASYFLFSFLRILF